MAEKSSQDAIMPLMQLKQVLALAERERLGCAFGLTKDKKEALLLIDKKAKPRKVGDTLKVDGKGLLDPATLRFGEVSIDQEADPGTVTFSVNRSEAGGTVSLMSRLIKKAGYQAIIINADPALDSEAAADVPPSPDVPAEAPPQAAPPAAERARLIGLVQRIGPAVAADPSRKEQLTVLAKEAQGLLGAGPSFDAKLQELEAALGPAANAATEKPAAADGPKVALAKSSLIWRSCRSQLHGKLDLLKAAVLDAYADEPEVAAELRKNLASLDRVFVGLDGRLEDTLDAAISATDPVERQALVAETRVTIGEYSKQVAGSPTVKAFDDNPFGVKLAFGETLAKVLTALDGLSATIH